MKTWPFLVACFFAAMLVPFALFADGKKDCTKNDPRCEAWKSGIASPMGKPIECMVKITAPTFGGKVALEVRRDGKSRWSEPRIKHVGPGVVQYNIGCGWFKEPTDEVYLCVQGSDGKEFYSRRTRSTGELDDVLAKKRLEMCLKGRECPKYIASNPASK